MCTRLLAEATATARELNTLAQSLQAALPALRTASRSASADIEGVPNRAFLLVLALVLIGIGGTLAAALAYQTLLPRLVRGSARMLRGLIPIYGFHPNSLNKR